MLSKKQQINEENMKSNPGKIVISDRFSENGVAESLKHNVKKESKKLKIDKKCLSFLVVGACSFVAGIICILCGALKPEELTSELAFPKIPSATIDASFYSALTGEPIVNESSKTAPAYCIQTPNGTDGARPQAGLNEAGVIFEAIAESGITRFAAIYQNPTSAVIGPIRSLRIYYLEWDTPFDCTIVHAGGAADALDAVAAGGYKDLSENYAYMYRGTYGGRLWNNLFTTATKLQQFNTDYGYTSSNINGFARMTPEESKKSRIDSLAVNKLNILKLAEGDTSEMNAEVSSIALNFGGWANFNVRYNYNADTNTYFRSYESGAAHEVYSCSSEDLGERNPEDVCSLTQMNPAVVIAMIVQEGKASDNYHEDIDTLGSGNAYIFQNGTVVKGYWNKGSREEQIKFIDENGEEIALAPGQTFVSAVPAYGSVEY